MTSMRTGQHTLVMKSIINFGCALAGLCACLAYILSLPMPLDKFSHDEDTIFGQRRRKDQMFLLIFQHS